MFLDNGVVYVAGRDKKFRPLVVLCLPKINQNVEIKGNEHYLIEALFHILVMVREKCLLPFHVERFNLFVDASDAAVIKSMDEFLDKVYEKIRLHFAESIFKIYISNIHIMNNLSDQWNRIL